MCFVGCSSLAVKPDGVLGYNNGIAIIQDTKTNSKVQFEVAQEVVGGFDDIPLILYISVENMSDNSLLFSTDNVSVLLNDKSLSPYTYDMIIRANVNIAQALYDYGIEVSTPNVNIVDPFFSSPAYYPYPVPVFFNGNFVMGYRYYDYSFARASVYSAQATQYNARKFLITHYLRKNTLNKNDVKGGFVLIPTNALQAGIMLVKVQVGKDIHTLKINLENLK